MAKEKVQEWRGLEQESCYLNVEVISYGDR